MKRDEGEFGDLKMIFPVEPFGDAGEMIEKGLPVEFHSDLGQQVRIFPDKGQPLLQLKSRGRGVVEDGVLPSGVLPGFFHVQGGIELRDEIEIQEILKANFFAYFS